MLACDAGPEHDQPASPPGVFVHVVAQNVGVSQPLAPDGRIELAFDSYLLPISIARQSFVLSDLRGNVQSPVVEYDPVARIVTILPVGKLQVDQSYEVIITTPSSPTDLNGLRSIDGATIDPAQATIEFPVVAGDGGAPPAAPTIDFCRDINPIFRGACLGSACHGGQNPAAGLRLDSPAAIAATAVGRPSQGSNTGPVLGVQPAGRLFGIGMPIIDPGNGGGGGGNPANSWMLYKLLLAVPSSSPSSYLAALCSGGGTATPADVSNLHVVMQPAFGNTVDDPARASLTEHVIGREMPFPADPSAPLESAGGTLTIDELERVSRWIAQPAGTASVDGGTATPPLIPASCDCIP